MAAAQHHAAEAEGQAAERHRLGDLRRRQPPMRIQPVAHRRARHRGKPKIVRQRVGAERGERDAAVGHLVARVDRAQPVVEGQHEIRQHGPAERQRQRARRDRVQRRADVAQAQMAELALHHVDRADQQHHAEQGGQIAEPRLHGLRNARTRPWDQAASAWRLSASRISAIVSGMPYSATKPPKRGPSCWPSNTW